MGWHIELLFKNIYVPQRGANKIVEAMIACLSDWLKRSDCLSLQCDKLQLIIEDDALEILGIYNDIYSHVTLCYYVRLWIIVVHDYVIKKSLALLKNEKNSKNIGYNISLVFLNILFIRFNPNCSTCSDNTFKTLSYKHIKYLWYQYNFLTQKHAKPCVYDDHWKIVI